MRSLRLDIALGPGAITAFLPASGRELRVACALEPGGAEDPGPALRQGLGRLEEAVRGELGLSGEAPKERIRVRAVLLPPFCEARLVDLPPLKEEEIRTVLQRDAARHFVGRSRPLVVGGARPEGGEGHDGAPPVLAAAAPAHLLRAVQGAIEARGWELDRIAAGHGAWLRALLEGVPFPPAGGEGGRGVRLLVAVTGETAHLVRMAGDTPERIRRVPTGSLEELVEAAGADPGWCLILAPGELRASLAVALKEAGWVIARPGEEAGAEGEAARHAALAEPELLPPTLAEARRLRNRRLAVRLLAAAVLVIAGAGVVHLWGSARELRAVQHARAELGPDVGPALAARDSLDRITERIEDLESIERASARWTYSLVELSMLLPIETHIVSLRAAGDTVVLEASGGRAGDALAALERAPTLSEVQLEGAIQREMDRGATARERFTLSAILSDRAPVPAVVIRTGPGEEGER